MDNWQFVYIIIDGFGKLGVHPRQVGVSVSSVGIPDRPLFALLTKNAGLNFEFLISCNLVLFDLYKCIIEYLQMKCLIFMHTSFM